MSRTLQPHRHDPCTKPIRFAGSVLQADAGYREQCRELRMRRDHSCHVIYSTRLTDAVHALHIFQKRPSTPRLPTWNWRGNDSSKWREENNAMTAKTCTRVFDTITGTSQEAVNPRLRAELMQFNASRSASNATAGRWPRLRSSNRLQAYSSNDSHNLPNGLPRSKLAAEKQTVTGSHEKTIPVAGDCFMRRFKQAAFPRHDCLLRYGASLPRCA
ncbi:MAG: hypothetical protein EPN36_05685 [Rhodanobacteraceae bacterium]|nr:MAG: hypothetical protein EPN36_05685 [Rhodanobacteraceae bacterium]